MEDLLPSSNGARYLLHECVFIDSCPNNNHTCLKILIEKLRNNTFDQVLLIHQNPVWTDEDYDRIRYMIKETNIKQIDDFGSFEF